MARNLAAEHENKQQTNRHNELNLLAIRDIAIKKYEF
jgi:hypothetical protein